MVHVKFECICPKMSFGFLSNWINWIRGMIALYSKSIPHKETVGSVETRGSSYASSDRPI